MAQKFLDENGLLYVFVKNNNTFQAKEEGKGLSSNDYTAEDKEKLKGIAEGAQKNVQADWSAETGDAFIKNKPVIPGKLSQLQNDKGFITADDVPEGAAASATAPKMSGTASVGAETAFARGDHVHPSDTSRIAVAEKGTPNGVATLGADGKVPSVQLPSYVDDVVEGYLSDGVFYTDSEHKNVIAGETGKIYIDISTNFSYRYGGTVYTQITSTDMTALSNQEIDQIFASAT